MDFVQNIESVKTGKWMLLFLQRYCILSVQELHKMLHKETQIRLALCQL